MLIVVLHKQLLRCKGLINDANLDNCMVHKYVYTFLCEASFVSKLEEDDLHIIEVVSDKCTLSVIKYSKIMELKKY
jgi:hypothetical protein